MTKPNLSRLLNILEVMRPSGSKTEYEFVDKVLIKTITTLKHAATKDAYGNVWVTVPNNDGSLPATMFSSHTDTVHAKEGKQKLAYDSAKKHILPHDGKLSGCLGADDGTGIWLMLHMLENNVPGLYAFHRDEECGGCGSDFGAANIKAPHIKHCIAFDRKGYSDIITHQGGTRTCSDEFAAALARHLPGYAASTGGSFTDSKNYRGVIAECTNLSVGYFAQHTSAEYQDLQFAIQLAGWVCTVPWGALPAARTPIIEKFAPARFAYDYTDPWWENYKPSNTTPPAAKRQTTAPRSQLSQADLYEWVKTHPHSAAFILYDMQVDEYDLLDAESETQHTHQAMVVQRTEPVRKVPPSGKEKVHRPGTGERTVRATAKGTKAP